MNFAIPTVTDGRSCGDGGLAYSRGMALLYTAKLSPTKMELLQAWAPSQPWFEGQPTSSFTNLGAYRFDDPDGEVGIETVFIRAGDGPVLQVPVTYRAAPLPGATDWLIGTMQHSVLGERWVYDAIGDPVYVAAVTAAITNAGHEAEQWVDTDGELVKRDPNATVVGSGATVPADSSTRLMVNRHPELDTIDVGLGTLEGSWSGQPETLTLVSLA